MFFVSGIKTDYALCLSYLSSLVKKKRKKLCACHCLIECFSWKFLKLNTCTSTDLKKPYKCTLGIFVLWFAPFPLEWKKTTWRELIIFLNISFDTEFIKWMLKIWLVKLHLLLSYDMSIKVKAHLRWPCCNQSPCGHLWNVSF